MHAQVETIDTPRDNAVAPVGMGSPAKQARSNDADGMDMPYWCAESVVESPTGERLPTPGDSLALELLDL